MKFNLSEIPAFGVAGNFTGHLEQAGEDKDFLTVKTAEVAAPKAIFPTYIPATQKDGGSVPDFLHIFPFDSKKINYPDGETKLQIEPECALICRLFWNDQKIEKIEPLYFGASNDCSIRKEGAKKISQKKNWGPASKGSSDNAIKIDRFEKGGILDDYRISSFLIRDAGVFQYGEDSAVRDYSYFYDKLLCWCVEKFNGQQDEGPAEKISDYLVECGKPGFALISVGATRYTQFGQSNFLQDGDRSIVIVYPESKYSPQEINDFVHIAAVNPDFKWNDDISVLMQNVEKACR